MIPTFLRSGIEWDRRMQDTMLLANSREGNSMIWGASEGRHEPTTDDSPDRESLAGRRQETE
jgi:hypothetical protein